MKRIKKAEVKKQRFFESKRNIVIVCIVAALAVVLIALLMLLEGNKEQVTIKNKTDLKLEYLQAYFVGEEGPVSEGLSVENMEAGQSTTLHQEAVNLLFTGSNLEIVFKFENYDELIVDAGIFNDKFTGNIKIDFEKTDDPEILKLKVKANNGILPSPTIDCDEEFEINLREGFIPE